jgi:hypothetical protein
MAIHYYQIDNVTGLLLCDAWIDGDDERGRLLQCREGCRWEDTDSLRPYEEGYRIYAIPALTDDDRALCRHIVEHSDYVEVERHGRLVGMQRVVALDGGPPPPRPPRRSFAEYDADADGSADDLCAALGIEPPPRATRH